MNELDKKLNDVFYGYVVRKDLVKLVRGNAAVPSYVLEYLLGQNCATDDEEQIAAGVERVRDILARHYVQRAEAGLVRSQIRESGYMRVIDKVSVSLNEKRDAYEATFENLGIAKVLVGSDTVKNNERLLVSGVWCIADLGYSANEAKDESAFLLRQLKPIQMARFDLDGYIEKRSQFTSDEWLDVLIRSIGLDPEQLGWRSKMFQLTRLISYCERNYNLIELGPKGTGKSHVFSEFSPHGILISGSEVTPAKLFVNNKTGKIGLVGFWDCVAFDEFAGQNKKPKADIVDIMKNYMANKSFSRGIEQVTAEASMAFVGNTSHDVAYMVNQTDLFEDLPAIYRDSAFIDRLHAYIPGWEVDIIRGDMFCNDYGFIVDYLAEALRALRALDYSGLLTERFEISDTLSTRDRDGVVKTYSGLMKILFPGKDATPEEEIDIIEFAMELRKRVKDQLYRIDETFERVDFSYRQRGGAWQDVTTLEEVDFPKTYHAHDLVAWEPPVRQAPAEAESGSASSGQSSESDSSGAESAVEANADNPAASEAELFAGHRKYRENQRGVTYDELFGAYLEGARNIEIVDPYIRSFHQCRNLMEVLEVALAHFDYQAPSLNVHLLTCLDDYATSKQDVHLSDIANAMEPLGLAFEWDYDESKSIHARHMVIDDKWDILLDRGLDIWQRFENDAFSVENRMQQMRRVKQFEITYLRMEEE